MGATRQSSKALILLVTCLGSFMVLLDGSIVTLALPSIQAGLHASLSDLQWTVDAYTLPFAALLLTAGTLGDRFGRKLLFQVGLVMFTTGSAMCGFAPSLAWLVTGRVVQGIGAAALSPGSLSILAAAFPDPRARAQAIGVWSGISGLALAAGPLIGGLLIQVASWQAIFLVNLPVGVIALILGVLSLPESRNPNAQHIDLLGQILVVAGLTCLIMGLIQSSSLGWTSALILGLFIAAALLLAVFLLAETRVREPLLPLELFGSRVFSSANVASLVLGFVILGIVFFLAQYFQAVQGSTALQAGLQTLPITVGTFIISPLAGQITSRVGARLPVVLGALLGAGGFFLLMNLAPDSSYVSVWWKLAMLGCSFGFMFSPLTVAVLSATPQTRAGLGSSIVSTSRQIGATLGVAVLGTVVTQQFANNIMSQFIQQGVPASTSSTIASKLAGAGAQASEVHLSGRLPLSPAALHQAVGQAFVNALHVSFLISGLILVATALLVGLLMGEQKKQRATSESREETSMPVASVE